MRAQSEIAQELGISFTRLQEAKLCECDAVAAAALEHWGKEYRITRELNSATIDCSTIVSQAHWIGAAIQTPFIAETQRHASNGTAVGFDNLLPGDAIFAYSSLAESPDGHHNHVALYLGQADDGVQWVIEAIGGRGVLLTKLSSVRTEGGIRRFCPRPLDQFTPDAWSDLVHCVPKLGRLGARLTFGYGDVKRHCGIDVYIGVGTQVLTPHHSAVVEVERLPGSAGEMIYLWSSETTFLTVLGPLRLHSEVKVGSSLRAGDVIGEIDGGAIRTRCNRIPGHDPRDLLHWELWAAEDVGCASPASSLEGPVILNRLCPGQAFRPYNALYASKMAIIGSCVRPIAC